MKPIWIAALLLTCASVTFAQDNANAANPPVDLLQEAIKRQHEAPQGALSPESVQAMVAMNKCIDSELGEAGFARIEEDGRAQQAAITELCKAGKKEDAIELQANYAKQMVESKEYKALHGCSRRYIDKIQGAMKTGFQSQMQRALPKTGEDICDPPSSSLPLPPK